MKIGDLQDQENHMAEVLISYDSAISSGDASSLSESSLREVTPVFNDPSFLTIGPTPTTSPKVSPADVCLLYTHECVVSMGNTHVSCVVCV